MFTSLSDAALVILQLCRFTCLWWVVWCSQNVLVFQGEEPQFMDVLHIKAKCMNCVSRYLKVNG